MKLPTFHNHKKYIDLFKKMDTDYQEDIVNSWDFQGDSILDRILKEGEVLIDKDQITEFISDDDFFRVKGKLVLVYIRDQFPRINPYKNNYQIEYTEEYIRSQPREYRYHLVQCQTIRTAIKDQRSERYVLRSPSYKGEMGDDSFKINIMDKTSKGILFTLNDQLKVCKNCLNQINDNSYRKLEKEEKLEIWNNFNYYDFFEDLQVQHLARLNFDDYRTSRKNIYPKDFNITSKKYRERKNWKCEECNIDLSDKNFRKYLHTHHKNAQKADNSIFNLKALCIECHSNKPKHEFIKNLPSYNYFIRSIKTRLSKK
jgi:hypothetical protein